MIDLSWGAALRARLARSHSRLARLATLRVRLTIAVAILSTAGLAASGALLTYAVESTVLRAIEDQSRAELHVIGRQIAHGVPIEEVHGFGAGRRLRFERPDGTVVEHRWTGPPGVAPPPPPGVARPPLPGEPALDIMSEHAMPWSVVELPLMSPRDGPLNAVALSPLDDVRRSTDTLQRVLWVGIPALVVLLTLAAWVLVGRALRPVRVMTQVAAGIADATAPDRLAVPPIMDELGELAHTLNGMLDRLALGAHRQREFVSDASHELRSPIAATRIQLEVALAHPERASPAAVLHGVLAETTRLEDLVADLLALARLDERPSAPHEELDLDDIVLEDAARVRAVPIDTRGVTGCKVRGERKSLCHLVRNLLDNATRHATSRVEASIRLDDGAPVLLVDDDGPGIPEADRARVFERFTRLSSSRTRDGDGGGAGLGLALVRRIAEQHGGRVRADRSPQGGARLEVRFPPSAGDGQTAARVRTG
jgi:signal transduction histidine kinase